MLGICKFDVFVVSLTSIKSLVCPHAILHFLFVCLAFKSMFFFESHSWYFSAVAIFVLLAFATSF